MTNTTRPLLLDPRKLTAKSGLTADQKRALPAPVLQGRYEQTPEGWSIDFMDWNEKEWRLGAKTPAILGKWLRYMGVSETVRDNLMKEVPAEFKNQRGIIGWEKLKFYRCVACKDAARRNPHGVETIWGCATCNVTGTPDSDLFEVGSKVGKTPPKPAVDAPEKPQEAPEPVETKPVVSMSLKERIAARKKEAGTT